MAAGAPLAVAERSAAMRPPRIEPIAGAFARRGPGVRRVPRLHGSGARLSVPMTAGGAGRGGRMHVTPPVTGFLAVPLLLASAALVAAAPRPAAKEGIEMEVLG